MWCGCWYGAWWWGGEEHGAERVLGDVSGGGGLQRNGVASFELYFELPADGVSQGVVGEGEFVAPPAEGFCMGRKRQLPMHCRTACRDFGVDSKVTLLLRLEVEAFPAARLCGFGYPPIILPAFVKELLLPKVAMTYNATPLRVADLDLPQVLCIQVRQHVCNQLPRQVIQLSERSHVEGGVE